MEQRIENTREEYVDQALDDYRRRFGYERGFDLWRAYLLGSLERISKRLGAVRYRALRQEMSTAIDCQRERGETGAHRDWIYVLLADYYDPMYDYQIKRNQGRLTLSGGEQDILDYLAGVGVI